MTQKKVKYQVRLHRSLQYKMFFQNIPLYTPLKKKKHELTLEKIRAQDDIGVFWLPAASFDGRNVEFQGASRITSTKTSRWVNSYFANLKNISPYFSFETIKESSQPPKKEPTKMKKKTAGLIANFPALKDGV